MDCCEECENVPEKKTFRRLECCRKEYARRYWKELKETYRLAWGLMLINLSQVMLNPVTTMFAGHLSKAALDSVALANSLINIFGNAVVLGMATACDTYFAQAFGNGQLLFIGVLLQRALAIHLLLLLILCVLYVNMEQALLLIGQDPEVSRLTAEYLLLSIPGLFFLFMYTILKKYITCQNYVVITVVIGFFGLGVNALLQYIFLYQLNYGILGSAVAQSLACFIMFVAIVVYIIWSGVYKTTWNGMQYQMLEDWWPFIKLGLYGMLMICLEWWAYEVSVLLAGILGTTELAAQGIFFNIEAIFISVGLGASDATAIRVGQFLGAGEPRKAALAGDVGFSSVAVFGIIISTLIASLRFQLPRLFTNIPEVIAATAELLPIMAYYTIFDNIAFIGRGITRGCGQQAKATLMIVVLYYFVGMPIGIPLMFLTPVANKGVWIGISVAVTLCAIGFFIYVTFFLNWEKASREAVERVQHTPDTEKTLVRSLSRSVSIGKARCDSVVSVDDIYGVRPPATDPEKHPLLGNSRKAKLGESTSAISPGSKRKMIIRRLLQGFAVLAFLAAGILCRIVFPAPHIDDGNYGNETTTDFTEFTTEVAF